MKSMHPFKTDLTETNILTQQQNLSRKKGHKIWQMITNMELDQYFTMI